MFSLRNEFSLEQMSIFRSIESSIIIVYYLPCNQLHRRAYLAYYKLQCTDCIKNRSVMHLMSSATRKLCYRKDVDKWIERAVAEMWPFEIIQAGGLPPSWI